jgi:hypothetical protein
MTDLNAMIWGRILERLLIVSFSGISLILGWSLFKIRLLKDQTAEFSIKDWRIRLERVGPGVFFALFGIAGLISSAAHPLSIASGLSEKPSAPGMTASQKGPASAAGLDINYAGSAIDSAADEVRAINTIEQFGASFSAPHANTGEKEAMARAVSVLDARKKVLLQAEFGPGLAQYEKWKADADQDPGSLGRLSPSDSTQFRNIDQLAHGTFIGAAK